MKLTIYAASMLYSGIRKNVLFTKDQNDKLLKSYVQKDYNSVKNMSTLAHQNCIACFQKVSIRVISAFSRLTTQMANASFKLN